MIAEYKIVFPFGETLMGALNGRSRNLITARLLPW